MIKNIVLDELRAYDANFFVDRALKRISRDSNEYNKIKSFLYETTMSCDLEEAAGWMEYYISTALRYDGTPIFDCIHRDLTLVDSKEEAAAMFLAAYDIYSDLNR